MKTFAQILLVIFFGIFFTLTLVSSTAKFQVLDYSFWVKSFESHNVYQTLSEVVKNSMNTQVDKQGGSKGDVTVLTDLITPENTADFVNHNLFNLLNFMNGKSADIKVYVPISKVTKGLLPKNITALNDEMTLNQLSQRFNIAGLDTLPLNNINQVGISVYYLWAGSVVISLVVLVLLFLLTRSGERLIAAGIALVLSGSISFLLVEAGKNIQKYMIQNFLPNPNMNQVLVGTVIPPVLGDIIQVWTYVGLGLVFGGVLLFFVKKSDYKKNNDNQR